jgi:hypothetical protein
MSDNNPENPGRVVLNLEELEQLATGSTTDQNSAGAAYFCYYEDHVQTCEYVPPSWETPPPSPSTIMCPW